MTVEMRLIGSHAELTAIEDALKTVVRLPGRRCYSSRRSSDDLHYFRGVALKDPSGNSAGQKLHVRRIDGFDVELEPLADQNHVFIAADFAAPGYVTHGIAASLNQEIQEAIRRIIYSKIDDVLLRLDQTYKPEHSGLILYNSGKDWLTIPFDDGRYDCTDDWRLGGDD